MKLSKMFNLSFTNKARFFKIGLICLATMVLFQNCGVQFTSDTATVAEKSLSSLSSYEHSSSDLVQVHVSPEAITNKNSAEFVVTTSSAVNYRDLTCAFLGTYGLCTEVSSMHEVTASGAHVFYFKATNLQSKSYALRIINDKNNLIHFTWVVDTILPTLEIIPEFSINTAENNAVFKTVPVDNRGPRPQVFCTLNSEPFKLCTDLNYFDSLAIGQYSFSAYAVDEAGNKSDIKKIEFEVYDLDPNTVVITSKPERETGQFTADFKFQLGANIANLYCQLNLDGVLEPCNNGINYTSLAKGSYRLYIVGRDKNGKNLYNTSYSWIILSPPKFNNHISNLVLPYTQGSYLLNLDESEGTSYLWSIAGRSDELTIKPENNFFAAVADVNRTHSYCVTAKNSLGEDKVCGVVIFSNFGINNGLPSYKEIQNLDLADAPGPFKIIGVNMAYDGKYLWFSDINKIAIPAEPTALSMLFYTVNNKVFHSILQNAVCDDFLNWNLVSIANKQGLASHSEYSICKDGLYNRTKLLGSLDRNRYFKATESATKLDYVADANRIYLLNFEGIEGYNLFKVAEPENLKRLTPHSSLTYTSLYYYDKQNLYYFQKSGDVVQGYKISQNLVPLEGQIPILLQGNYVQIGTKLYYNTKFIPDVTGPYQYKAGYLLAGTKLLDRGVVVLSDVTTLELIAENSAGMFLKTNSGIYYKNKKTKLLSKLSILKPENFVSVKATGVIDKIELVYYDEHNYFYDGVNAYYLYTNRYEDGHLFEALPIGSDASVLWAPQTAVLFSSQAVYVKNSQFSIDSGHNLKYADLKINRTYYVGVSKDIYAIDEAANIDKFINIGPATVLNSLFAKNCASQKVYYKTSVIADAYCDSFEVSSVKSNYARDNLNCYLNKVKQTQRSVCDPYF